MKKMLVNRSGCFLSLCMVLGSMMCACSGVDRSGEQPFPPTVRTLSCEVAGDSCILTGIVDAAPNSPVRQQGFWYGNDTLQMELISADSLAYFHAVADSLLPGRYYGVAYATNGMGTSFGDTLFFVVP